MRHLGGQTLSVRPTWRFTTRSTCSRDSWSFTRLTPYVFDLALLMTSIEKDTSEATSTATIDVKQNIDERFPKSSALDQIS